MGAFQSRTPFMCRLHKIDRRGLLINTTVCLQITWCHNKGYYVFSSEDFEVFKENSHYHSAKTICVNMLSIEITWPFGEERNSDFLRGRVGPAEAMSKKRQWGGGWPLTHPSSLCAGKASSPGLLKGLRTSTPTDRGEWFFPTEGILAFLQCNISGELVGLCSTPLFVKHHF